MLLSVVVMFILPYVIILASPFGEVNIFFRCCYRLAVSLAVDPTLSCYRSESISFASPYRFPLTAWDRPLSLAYTPRLPRLSGIAI